MDAQSAIQSFINYLPADTWAYLLASLGLSALLQKVKHWLTIESPKVLVVLTSIFSFAGAVIPALIGWLAVNPSVLGAHTAAIFTGMTLGYRFVIKPASDFLGEVKEFKKAKSVFAETPNATVSVTQEFKPEKPTVSVVSAVDGGAKEFEG